MQYDSSVIVKSAEKLYSAAAATVLACTLLLGLVGAAVGAGVFGLVAREAAVFGAVLGGLVFGAMGYLVGTQRAFTMRLQAQQALCQVQIELNTRRG